MGDRRTALISPDDLASLEETLDLLSDRKAIKELRDAERAVAAATSSEVSTPSASSAGADGERYLLVVAGPAAQAIADVLPGAVALAVLALITGDLVAAPRRAGKPLRRELEGLWVARRGTFGVVYRIDEGKREVVVLRIDHRRDVYRSR